MKKLINRFLNATLMFIWAFKNPTLLNIHNFTGITQLFAFLLRVATENKPYMTKIAQVIAGEEHCVVSIWAGPGVNADPTDRITELLAINNKLHLENIVLQEQLSNRLKEAQ